MNDPIVDAVCKDLQDRSRIGMLKYGTTLARTDLDHKAWLEHAYFEALDMANYLKRAIMDLEEKEP